ncbi:MULTISPECIES: hypothetical protein [Burkholderiaceae]|uniref:Uncharacterized protein n=1 Tax=Caballeronia sordidicola TaxID=196367 RepID=A0A242N5J5_CABSO|nr:MULTISPECIES: hypothetical protein [Burkholderiaceae]OTP78694.1 hypothetical protein PAMC26577_03645 [Caballeronia sordidicola]
MNGSLIDAQPLNAIRRHFELLVISRDDQRAYHRDAKAEPTE